MVIDRCMRKTEMAWHFSFQTLFASGPCWFWTFTPWCVMSDAQFAAAWNRFSEKLRYVYRWEPLTMLRAFEPFQSGFLHCHAIIDRRIPVDLVRRLARNTGIGRVHVRRCVSTDADYLAHYLGKASWRLPDGRKAWAALGLERHTRVCDVETDSNEARNMRWAYDVLFRHVAAHGKRVMAARQFVASMRFAGFSSEAGAAALRARSAENRRRKDDERIGYDVVTLWND